MRRAPVPLSLSILVGALGVVGATGCGACDTTNQAPIEYREGITTEAGPLWIYESTAVNDDWLHFPPGRIYDLFHGLPGIPQTWDADVSFKSRLDPGGDSGTSQNPNNAAPAAGNQVVVDAKWGPNIVRIRNDTCAEVYVRFVALYGEGDSRAPTMSVDPDDAE